MVMESMIMIPFKKLRCVSSICMMSFAQDILISGVNARRMNRCMLPSTLRDVNTNRHGSSGEQSSMPKQLIYERYKYRNKHLPSYLFCLESPTFFLLFLTLMLFLQMYPGREKPFFRSIGSLRMTSCSKRNTRLSLGRERMLFSFSMNVKVSCCKSFPCALS